MDDSKSTPKPESALIQFLRFNIVGIGNTAFTYALFSALVFLGVRDLVALCIEYPVGICISFYFNKRFTFRVKGPSLGMFIRSVLVYVPSLGANMLLLWVLTERFGINSYVAQLVSVGIVTVAVFLLHKKIVFRSKEESTHGGN